MAEMALPAERLVPPDYHRRLAALLKTREAELWQWACSSRAQEEHSAQIRAQLLQHTRLDEREHGDVFRSAAVVAERLQIAAPIALYQSSEEAPMNAALWYLSGEVHVVFSGALIDTLSSAELDAVLGHEMAHYKLWEADQHDYLIVDQLVGMAADDAGAAGSHRHTARRLRLYTEIYADRGAFAGCGDLEATVAALTRTATGAQVVVSDYLRQADELLAQQETLVGHFSSAEVQHPETFIRARALRLWADGDAQLDTWLSKVIEGGLVLEELDLLGQERLTQATRLVIGELLSADPLRTALMLAHARSYFGDFEPVNAGSSDDELKGALGFIAADTRDYLCYLLLDFVALDKKLGDAALEAARALSVRLDLGKPFEQMAQRELRLTKRQLARFKKHSGEASARAVGQA